MQTLAKIYLLLNAVAFMYIGYEIDTTQVFATSYLAILFTLGSYTLHTNEQKTLS